MHVLWTVLVVVWHHMLLTLMQGRAERSRDRTGVRSQFYVTRGYTEGVSCNWVAVVSIVMGPELQFCLAGLQFHSRWFVLRQIQVSNDTTIPVSGILLLFLLPVAQSASVGIIRSKRKEFPEKSSFLLIFRPLTKPSLRSERRTTKCFLPHFM